MTEVILLGIDGSPNSERAADMAAEHARAAGRKLLVAHVIEWSPYTFNTPEENEVRHRRREEEIDRAEAHVVRPIVERLRRAGVESETVVRHGHAAEMLGQLAKEHDVKQIYVGRIGQSRLRDLLFGSVAGSLVQISPVPVTVVP
ncbi:MAG TPA: universal stress protein [Geminicoccaceae bacterium]